MELEDRKLICSDLQIEKKLKSSQTAGFECQGISSHLCDGLGITLFFPVIKNCVAKLLNAFLVALHQLSFSIANAEFVLEYLCLGIELSIRI